MSWEDQTALSGTYKMTFCISGLSLIAACVRHAEGASAVHSTEAKRSP
ncbi:MAG: hypothetical protein NZ455_06740 [Bacteroidia bacterium]|nr:hypothetical protein [Bacteroidia bacterium]MDW8346044.1 hypothetical protein [Bacteroidia bacterium]